MDAMLSNKTGGGERLHQDLIQDGAEVEGGWVPRHRLSPQITLAGQYQVA